MTEQTNLFGEAIEEEEVSESNKEEVASTEQEKIPSMSFKKEDIKEDRSIEINGEIFYVGANNEDLYTEAEWNRPAVLNGPYRYEVEFWKLKYDHIFFTPLANNVYIWRMMDRQEYHMLTGRNELETLEREEEIAAMVTLFPRDMTVEKMANTKAGVATMITEMCMEKSGFSTATGAIEL